MPTQTITATAIPIDHIHPNPNQPRKYFDPQALEDLKESIAKRGLINPLSVVKSGDSDYTIIAGERRYRAAKDLKLDQIDCRVWPAETSLQEVEMLSLVENLQRDDLNPIEIANGYRLLVQPPYDMTQEEIAKQVGKTQQAVNQYLSITKLDAKVQEITNRFVNLGLAHLVQLCRLKRPEDQLEMAKKASEADWSVKELTREMDKMLGKPAKASRLKEAQPADPLANVWPILQQTMTLTPYAFWEVKFGAHQVTKGVKLNGWFSFVEQDRTGSTDPRSQLAAFHQQMADALRNRLENGPVGQRPIQSAESSFINTLQPRIPKTAEERKELETISIKEGPQKVMEWIHGEDSPMSKIPFKTWEEIGMDPIQGLNQILYGIRKMQGDSATAAPEIHGSNSPDAASTNTFERKPPAQAAKPQPSAAPNADQSASLKEGATQVAADIAKNLLGRLFS